MQAEANNNGNNNQQDNKQPAIKKKSKNQEVLQYILAYREIRKVKGIKITTKQTNYYQKAIKAAKQLLSIQNLAKVSNISETHKVIYVEPGFQIGMIVLDADGGYEIVEADVELTHKNYSAQDILNWFVPKQQQLAYPNSFESVGHMAHFNLTADQIAFKEVIGEITLLRSLSIKTVVNKTQKLHNVYRTPTLQHMAGDHNYIVKLKQVGITFELDFQKVYWCSRLQIERDRLLKMMKPNEFLADIFCGVGPLAVRAAKKGLRVLANDLNPFCHQYLQHNMRLNKVECQMLCWNLCAREAMRRLYRQRNQLAGMQAPDHIYMNLPVDAIEFLDVLKGYGKAMGTAKMPLVHVNCFVVADSDQKSMNILEIRIQKVLPTFRKTDILHQHHIKNVTVIMRMYCLTFRLREGENHNEQGDGVEEQERQRELPQKKIKNE